METNRLTVVQGNDLVEASYTLSIDEIRLVSLAATKIDSRKSSSGEIEILPQEYAQAFNLNPKCHRLISDGVKSLSSKTAILPIKGVNGVDMATIPWLQIGMYSKNVNDTSRVIIRFNPLIEPFLFELKERFTSLDFNNIVKLNSPFSFRLYQWLVKERNMDSHKKNGVVVVSLDLGWMKSKAGLEGKYPKWAIFADKVIKPAVAKINANTDISVVWKPIKTGRKVSSIQFSFIEEIAKEEEPLRPRLYRRPKVLKGSHAEGEWKRHNAELLLDYLGKSLQYNPAFKLTIPDLKKLIDYVSIYDSSLESKLKLELNSRQKSK